MQNETMSCRTRLCHAELDSASLVQKEVPNQVRDDGGGRSGMTRGVMLNEAVSC